MSLQTHPLNGAFGKEVLDIRLDQLSDTQSDELVALWQAEPLLLIRQQAMTEDELVQYGKHFGELDIMVRDDMISHRNPEVIYITNLHRGDGARLGGLGSYEVDWHTDQIYRKKPPTGSVFLAIEIPDEGPETWWCNTEMAFAALPQQMQDELMDKTAISKYGVKQGQGFQRDFKENETSEIQKIHDRTPAVAHPMVLKHPVSGKHSLYIDPAKSHAIEGMPDAQAQALLKELTSHMTREEFVYKHQWRPGDVMMWDNARLCHRREGFSSEMPRFAKRLTIHMPKEKFPVPPEAA